MYFDQVCCNEARTNIVSCSAVDEYIGGIFANDRLNKLHSRIKMLADVFSWFICHWYHSVSVLLREHWTETFVQRYDVCDVVLRQELRILCGSYVSQIEIVNDFIHILFQIVTEL